MITIDMADALAEIDALALRLAIPDALFAKIGAHEVAAAKNRIESTKTAPDGTPWVSWAVGTLLHRNRKGNADQGMLWDEGDLLDSIMWQADGGTLEIGTPDEIGLYQQEGTRGPGVGPSGWHVPPREFLGWTPGSEALYEAMTIQYLAGVLQ